MYSNNPRTKEERKVQKQLNLLAAEEKNKRRDKKVRYQKITINKKK